MYDRSSEFWQMLYNVFKMAEKVRAADHQKMHKSAAVKWAQFWGAHQRFFRQMLLSAKVGCGCELKSVLPVAFERRLRFQTVKKT